MIQRKQKSDNVPIPNPATLREINVPEELRRTLRGDVFLMHDSGPDDPNIFWVFATQENLKNLVQYREWFADGTFKIAPHLFYQIYTIHCLCQDATQSFTNFNWVTRVTARINNVILKRRSSGTRGCFWRKRKYKRMLLPPFPDHMAPYTRAKSSTDVQRYWGVTTKVENVGCSCICTT